MAILQRLPAGHQGAALNTSARLGLLAFAAVALAGLRLAVPLRAPLLHQDVPVAAAASVDWSADIYVVDARPGAHGRWPRLDERRWDDGLARILADGAFTARILVIADPANAAQVVQRLARDLPEADVAFLLDGADAVPGGQRWRGGGR